MLSRSKLSPNGVIPVCRRGDREPAGADVILAGGAVMFGASRSESRITCSKHSGSRDEAVTLLPLDERRALLGVTI